MRMHWLAAFVTGILASIGAHADTASTQPPLVVFAATSLTESLQEIGNAYTRKTDQMVTLSFAASARLAHQIEAGSPVDVFMPADAESMDYAEKRHLIVPGSRRDVLRNRLVLIAPASSLLKVDLAPGIDLAAVLGKGRLAMADPEIVAAGRYARYALISLGAWNSLGGRLMTADNMRSVVAFVAREEAPLGIVYETDVLNDKRVQVVDAFPVTSHPQIVYPVALTPKARAGAERFAAFLRSAEGREIFRRHGFRPVP